ncbi:MAG: bifunctional phosphoglucose/phosphomannose isomerase [bacterium]
MVESEFEIEKEDNHGFIEGFSRKHDPKGMLSWVEDWPGIIIRGQDEFILNDRVLSGLKPDKFDKIIMSGMGGSAMACELISALIGHNLKMPMEIARGYGIPLWVDNRTLFIAVSYSGNTEEVIWNTTQAYNAGAQIIAVTSGGGLRDIAIKVGFEFIKVYSQCPTPRAALGYLLMPLLKLFMDFELIGKEETIVDVTESIKTIIRERKKYTFFLDEEKNFAKKLARELRTAIPVIWSGSQFTRPVALRWQHQLNENSKSFAHYSHFPEMNHNEILSFQFRKREWIIKDILLLVLRDPDEHPRNSLRIDFSSDIVRPMIRGLYQIKPKGKSRLCRMLNHIQIADYVSVYLALLTKTDPSVQNHIDDLKKKIHLIR